MIHLSNDWWQRSTLKSGKPGNRVTWIPAYYSVLDRCEHCGRLSSANWVKKWWFRGYLRVDLRARHREPEHEPVLCMGCFNKFRPLWKRANEALENRLLINRLKREVTDAGRRHKNNG